MTKTKENMSIVRKMLKSEGLKYKEDCNKFLVYFSDEAEEMIQIIVVDDSSIVFSTGVTIGSCDDISEGLMKINTGIRHGAFLMEPKTETVVFRTSIHCAKRKAAREDVKFHFMMGLHSISKLDQYMEEYGIDLTPKVSHSSEMPFYS